MSLRETRQVLVAIEEAQHRLEVERAAMDAEHPRPVFECVELAGHMKTRVAIVLLGGPEPTGIRVSIGRMYLAPTDAVALGRWLIETCEEKDD